MFLKTNDMRKILNTCFGIETATCGHLGWSQASKQNLLAVCASEAPTNRTCLYTCWGRYCLAASRTLYLTVLFVKVRFLRKRHFPAKDVKVEVKFYHFILVRLSKKVRISVRFTNEFSVLYIVLHMAVEGGTWYVILYGKTAEL